MVTVKDWDIPRKSGEPCAFVVVGKVREALVQSWLHHQVFFAAPDEDGSTENMTEPNVFK